LMPAIVLDDKDAHQEKGSYNRQTERDQIGPVETEVHQYPKAYKRKKGVEQLNNSFSGIGFLIVFYHYPPVLESFFQMKIVH